MTDSIAIRLAKSRENQLLSYLAFRSKAYWGYSPEFMEACRAEISISEGDISNPHRHYVLAESKGKIVGYYAIECLSADKYELAALFVEPQYIRQGIGIHLNRCSLEGVIERYYESGAYCYLGKRYRKTETLLRNVF